MSSSSAASSEGEFDDPFARGRHTDWEGCDMLSTSYSDVVGEDVASTSSHGRDLQYCSSNLSQQESHGFRMQQVGDRVLLEELLAESGVTFSDIRPKRHARRSDLDEVTRLEGSPSSKEPMSCSFSGHDRWTTSEQQLTVDLKHLTIGTVIAIGSAGRIYYGCYKGQEVAVKVFKQTPACTGHPSFPQEVSFLSHLKHPHIVKFLGAYNAPPLQLHITEFLAEGSLRDYLERVPSDEPIPYAQRLRMARDVASGLGYLHSLRILHRDCKSENMVIAADGTLKLTDFGIARMEGEPENMTSETGTYRYMAPEVIGHRPYNSSADVYSFGLVLWETLSGQLPFAGMNAVQAAFAVVNKHERPVIPKSCPPAIRSLIQACWHPNPSKRPEFAHILATLETAIERLEAPSPSCPLPSSRSVGCWSGLFKRHTR